MLVSVIHPLSATVWVQTKLGLLICLKCAVGMISVEDNVH